MRQTDPRLEAEYLALLQAEDYARAEKSLAHFLKGAWEVLEPATHYVHGWHIDCLAEHLEAVYLGQIRRLIVNMPPRELKSILCTVAYPAWVWTKSPAMRFIAASYSASLSIKHSVDRRTLIESAWYQRGWGKRFQLRPDQNQKSEFENDKRGGMLATSVGGSAIGKGMDTGLLDDPVNPAEAASEKAREAANNWIDQGFLTRFNDKRTGSAICVMQRLHEKDPTGHLLSKGGWHHLCLPQEATKKTIVVFPISKRKVTRAEGEALNPERTGPKEIAEMKLDLGSAGYQAQHQQDPRPSAGGFFKRKWWKRYRELPMNRIRRVQFWDCAEQPGLTNDFSVCATWDETPTGYYLVDLWVQRVAFPELQAACKDLFAQHRPDAVVIENKSAGTQLLQNLADSKLPLIPYEPGQRSKIVRAAGAQPTVESGNCYLPEDRAWIELFLSRHEKFPNDEHDDEVDTTSMMVEYFRTPAAEPGIRIL